ncbi:MAG: hypothetical protein A3F40_03400 [Chlamydiae bacterium RIFCSPHIGHO2_12_FULL_27_8]|nr:MAG: hypothetical protein A3F40_03400 [Chlamydiae bacterium RIFCSPHIGHO2_12_FULL_27_8]OGN67052.1 MAG: hypothetical protein A2888_01790 [Chlamydiae bacterium RIFCSPLOWO2_01_FULL_28_7]
MNIKNNFILSMLFLCACSIYNVVFSYFNFSNNVNFIVLYYFFSVFTLFLLMFLTYYLSVVKKGVKFLSFIIILYSVGLILSPYSFYKSLSIEGSLISYFNYFLYIISQLYFIISAFRLKKQNIKI